VSVLAGPAERVFSCRNGPVLHVLPSPDLALPDRRLSLIAAADAAASWARARRETWSHAPLTSLAEAVHLSAFEDEPGLVVVQGPSTAERIASWARSVGPSLVPWLARAAALAALTAAGATARVYWTSVSVPAILKSSIASIEAKVEPRKESAAAPHGTTGRLRVRSEPPGAHVVVDGRHRGTTPLTLDGLRAGVHAVVLTSSEGSVKRSVTISAAATSDLNESIFAGWLAVFSPFELTITEGTRAFHLDDRNQIMLPPGPHALHLANRALGYEEVREVELQPGEVASLQVALPHSTITVNASASAEVWVDGALAGETPLTALSVALGTHEVVVKRSGDARRFVVTVTVKPVNLTVDFSKPVA
jgi:hypothetical protein